MPPIPMQGKTISDSKLVTFAVGTQKKSRFQKAREDAVAKKSKDEQEAAKVYEGFVASFETEGGGGAGGAKQAFVRGGGGGNGGTGGTGGGGIYRPPGRGGEMDKMLLEMQGREAAASAPSSTSSAPLKTLAPKGSRQIDFFLDEIKSAHQQGTSVQYFPPTAQESAQQSREAQRERERGSHDRGDQATTNLYIGNLAPTATEEHLLALFGRCGPINSVKVMWPRTDEERARKRNCGFVSFKSRVDAEDALLELQDYDLEALASAPAAIAAVETAGVGAVGEVAEEDFSGMSVDLFLSSVIAGGGGSGGGIGDSGALIDLLASYTAADGDAFEKVVRSQEEGENGVEAWKKWEVQAQAQATAQEQKQGAVAEGTVSVGTEGNLGTVSTVGPPFAFLYYPMGAFVTDREGGFGGSEERAAVAWEAVYYRWRVYANVWGDSADTWSPLPVQWSSSAPTHTSDPLVLLPPVPPLRKRAREEEGDKDRGDGEKGERDRGDRDRGDGVR
ncbi:hypothetical protein B484DRAFT_389608, partial [Ochromonadaceae sp. CCMP2298]